MAYNSLDYTDLVIEHYENPRNTGDLEAPDGVATVENPACGDTMRLAVRIRSGSIVEARFKSQGCPAAIAAGSVTTQLVLGRSLEEASRLSNKEVALALGGLPPAKLHCSVLAEQAVRAVIADYGRRRRSAAPKGGAAAAPPSTSSMQE